MHDPTKHDSDEHLQAAGVGPAEPQINLACSKIIRLSMAMKEHGL
jgi:hypothetical protein